MYLLKKHLGGQTVRKIIIVYSILYNINWFYDKRDQTMYLQTTLDSSYFSQKLNPSWFDICQIFRYGHRTLELI